MYINNNTYGGEIADTADNYSSLRAIAAAAADMSSEQPTAPHMQLLSNIMEKAADMLSSVELQQQQQQQKNIFGGSIVDLRPGASLIPTNITYSTSKYCSRGGGEFVLFMFYITCFIVLIIIAYFLDIGHSYRLRKSLRAPPHGPPPLMSSTPFVERKILKETTPSPSLSSEPIELVPVFQPKHPYKTEF